MSLQIHIHSPGRHIKDVEPLINEYEKRISRYASLKWHFTKTGTKEEENKGLRDSVKSSSYFVLDEHGINISTEEIASELTRTMHSGSPIMHIIIGGAYGLESDLINGAQNSWAFGSITLPHQLVRLIASEQFYRAITIINHHPYHHT